MADSQARSAHGNDVVQGIGKNAEHGETDGNKTDDPCAPVITDQEAMAIFKTWDPARRKAALKEMREVLPSDKYSLEKFGPEFINNTVTRALHNEQREVVLNRMRLEVAKAEARLAIGRSDIGDGKMPPYELMKKMFAVLEEGMQGLDSVSNMFENLQTVEEDEGDEEQKDGSEDDEQEDDEQEDDEEDDDEQDDDEEKDDEEDDDEPDQ